MNASYKKLWKLLIDKDMKKKDLMEQAGISSFSIRKLNRGEKVTMEVLGKICKALDCSWMIFVCLRIPLSNQLFRNT